MFFIGLKTSQTLSFLIFISAPTIRLRHKTRLPHLLLLLILLEMRSHSRFEMSWIY